MLLKAESYKKGIVQSSAVNVTGKVIAFIQQWLIGFYFGSYSGTDLFFFTYNIILFISYFFLNLTTSVVVPEAIRLRVNKGEDESESLVNSFIVIYGVVGALITILGLFFTEYFFEIISSFPAETIENNVGLIRWCTPLVFLTMFVNLLTEVLASYRFFTMPNFANAVNSVLAVVFVVVFHEEMGLASVVIGLLAGAFINVVVILWMMRKKLGWNFTLFNFEKIKHTFSYGIYAQLGFIVYLIAMYVPQYLFSDFEEGSLTAMNYADKIANIPGIFLITQITNVMAIKFNSLVSNGDVYKIAMLTEKLVIYVSGGLLLLAVVMSVCSDWIVEILFGMTNISGSSLQLTSDLLALMMLYLPVGFSYNMFIRIFNAYSKQKYVLWIQTLTQSSIIVLYYLLIPSLGELSFPVLRLIPYTFAILAVLPLLGRLCPKLRTIRLFVFNVLIVVVVMIPSVWLLCR